MGILITHLHRLVKGSDQIINCVKTILKYKINKYVISDTKLRINGKHWKRSHNIRKMFFKNFECNKLSIFQCK